VQSTDRHNGGVGGRYLPGHDALESHHGRRGHDDWVDRRFGARAVRPATVQHDAQRIGGREGRAGPEPEQPGGEQCHVLAEHHLRAAESVEQPVVDHGLGALTGFFGGLEDQEQRSLPWP
jgi:hypothetical protein